MSILNQFRLASRQPFVPLPGPLLLLLGALFLFSVTVCAAPFRNLPVQFTQPDGTRVEIMGSGDEFSAHFETRTGFTVVFDPALKAYCYAQSSETGELASTGRPIHLHDPASLGLDPHLRSSVAAQQKTRAAKYERWENAMQIRPAWQQRKATMRALGAARAGGPQFDPPASTTIGLKVGLTLLIDFDDSPATIPRAEILQFLNGDSYSGYGNNGSVKNYFADNSGGRLTYTNIVTIYLRIPNSLHPKSYYNNVNRDAGEQGNQLIRDALQILKSLPNYYTEILPAFDSLSVDDQNQVLACNVFYAGDNGGVWSMGLWPHSWTLAIAGPQELSSGGKKIWRYQITNIGNNLSLGTFCHENGHMLCDFPDIYDYDYDSSGGAGMFCLMNSGGHGNNPVQICAYLKTAAGWATVEDLDGTSRLNASLSALAGQDFNKFYRFKRPDVSTEYFLLECRYATNRDAWLPGSGIAIWHIDELGDKDNQSRTPNETHSNYEVTLVQADNLWHLQAKANDGDADDLFYGDNRAQEYANQFTDSSQPAASWWDGTPSGATFYDFSAASTTMSFQVGYANMAPQFSRQPSDKTVIEGLPVTLSAVVIGTGPMSYQWDFAGNPIAGANLPYYTIPAASTNDAGSYRLTVQNALGSATSRTALLSVVPAISLAEALERPGSWSTGGDSIWTGQTTITHDTVDAAASGSIGDLQDTWMETTWTGSSGVVEFWWSCSSEPAYDFLRFYIDGVEQSDGIAGERPWTFASFEVSPGTHTLRWAYEKDDYVSGGADAAWLDQVVFRYDSLSRPVFVSEPPDQTNCVSDDVSLKTELRGTWPIQYQWYANRIPLPAGTNLTLLLTNISMALAGEYYMVASNHLGSTTSRVARLTIVPAVSLAEATETPAWDWRTGSAFPWRGQVTRTHDGADAARSSSIKHNQTSWSEATVEGPCAVSFWWKVSSEEKWDVLEASVDAMVQVKISGEKEWHQSSVTVPAGTHVVRWTYRKDGSLNSGEDCAWLDSVSVGAARTLSDALDNTNIVWRTTGDATWLAQNNTTHDGVDAAQSGDIGDFEVSSLFATVTGPGTLTFWWSVSCEEDYDYLDLFIDGNFSEYITGEVPWLFKSITVSAGVHEIEWFYNKDTTSSVGADAAWVDQVTFVRDIALEEALDIPTLGWASGGAAPWKGQDAITHDGSDAAQTGLIYGNQETWMESVVDGPGTLYFWCRVSSEPDFDKVTCSINGATQFSLSGQVPWEQRSLSIPPGSQVVRWAYTKDTSISMGEDRAWLDQVTFVSAGSRPVISAADPGSGTFKLQVLSPAGAPVVVETSTNLVDWLPLVTNTAPFTVTQPATDTESKRVYRALLRN